MNVEMNVEPEPPAYLTNLTRIATLSIQSLIRANVTKCLCFVGSEVDTYNSNSAVEAVHHQLQTEILVGDRS